MGSEASKPLEPPPEGWDRRGNQFEIISPVSDISNPSEINRNRRVQAPTTHDRNRRASRTVTKSLSGHQQKQVPAPSAFYFPTKETERRAERSRRSDEKRSNDDQKENEKPKGTLKKLVKKTQQAMTGCFAENHATTLESEQIEEEQKQQPRTSKTKKASKSQQHQEQQEQQRHISDFDAKPSKEQKKMSSGESPRRHSRDAERSSVSEAAEGGGQPLFTKQRFAEHSFVIREAEGLVEPEEYCTGNEDTLKIAGMALHHEDAYFASLTSSKPKNYREVQDSPCAVNGNQAFHNLPSALGSVSEPSVTDSPVSNLFADADKETTHAQDTSDSRSSTESAEKTDPSGENIPDSPVSNLLRFQTQIAQLSSASDLYDDEEDKSIEVFLDEALDETYDSSEHEKMLRKQQVNHTKNEDGSVQSHPSAALSLVSIVTMGTFASYHESQFGEQSKTKSREQTTDKNKYNLEQKPGQLVAYAENAADDDSAVLSYFRPEERNTESAFRLQRDLPEDPMKQIATLGPSSNGPRATKTSKLESLFRPVLPALSADDAQSRTSYDPYEIKVTESAPSVIESADYRALALRSNYGSPESLNLTKSDKLGHWSPSMISIDSQVDQSPAITKVMVSDQATCNSEFLFASDYMSLQRPARSNRDSSIFSISTIGARSRTSARTKAVPIPVKSSQSVASDDSSRNSGAGRRVRFSTDTISLANESKASGRSTGNAIDIPSIETKMSDLTDTMTDFGRHLSSRGSKSKTSRAPIPEDPNENEMPETNEAALADSESLNELFEDAEPGSPNERVQWYHTTKDGFSAVTPHLKGDSLKDATNSPYLRYQVNRSKYESQSSDKSAHATIDLPAIESKVSDLTDAFCDFGGRSSVGSSKSNAVHDSIPEEESESEPAESQVSDSPEMQAHWSYSVKDGNLSAVTPQFKGKSLQNATKSPFLRFKSAKKKFTDPVTKVLPVESPKKTKAKNDKNSSLGVVSSRIEALNKRVVETRKLRRKQRSSVGNPRRHNFVATNHIRSCAILNYKTEKVDVDKIHFMAAAKFNRIPDPLDEDLSVVSSEYSEVDLSYQEIMNKHMAVLENQGEYFHDQEIEECEEDDMSKATDSVTVATMRQERESDVPRYQARVSESSQSTVSSGLNNVRKQVFRSSNSVAGSRKSHDSYGESTTMSSILDQENATYLPFRAADNTVKPTEQHHHVTGPESLHLSPTQRTPMEARKWRSLAAAAKEKSSKKMSSKKVRKGLSERKNRNVLAYVR